MISLDLDALHVGRESEYLARHLRVEIAHRQAVVGRRGEIAAGSRKNEPPFAEGWYVGVVRVGLESGLAQRGLDRPIGVRCEIRRRRLYDHQSMRGDALLQQRIKGHRIQLAKRESRGIGKVDERDIETILAGLDPPPRPAVLPLHPRRPDPAISPPR